MHATGRDMGRASRRGFTAHAHLPTIISLRFLITHAILMGRHETEFFIYMALFGIASEMFSARRLYARPHATAYRLTKTFICLDILYFNRRRLTFTLTLFRHF